MREVRTTAYFCGRRCMCPSPWRPGRTGITSTRPYGKLGISIQKVGRYGTYLVRYYLRYGTSPLLYSVHRLEVILRKAPLEGGGRYGYLGFFHFSICRSDSTWYLQLESQKVLNICEIHLPFMYLPTFLFILSFLKSCLIIRYSILCFILGSVIRALSFWFRIRLHKRAIPIYIVPIFAA